MMQHRADRPGDAAARPGIDPAAVAARRCYGVHGHRVDVLCADTQVCEVIHDVLAHLGFEPADAPGTEPDAVLRCSADPSSVRVPAGARVIAEQSGIEAWSGGEALYLECDGHACRLDLDGGAAEMVLPSPPSPPRKDFVTYALLLLLRRRGLYALHASGVAHDGAGCLFVAPSGSGKSTQTYALVRRGWAYLGDDALLFRLRGDAVEALAMRRDLCLDPALAPAFPEVSSHGKGGPFAGKGKRRLPMRALHPGRLIDRCVPRTLVFPEIADAPASRLVPLAPADALGRLMRESVVLALDPTAIPAHVHALGRLVRQTRSWRLLAGRDLRDAPERIADLLVAIDGPTAPASDAAEAA